jgi:hypothetical protein
VQRVLRLLRRASFAAAWLAGAGLIAFGAAGVVAGIDHAPGTSARPEVTWAGDQAVRPALVAATADLEQLSAEVDRLAVLARGALGAITARDRGLLDATLGSGSVLVGGIQLRVAGIRTEVDGLPGFGADTELRVAADSRTRRELILEALGVTDRLGGSWAVLVSGGLTATRLAGLLERHDDEAFAAITAGRAGDYQAAQSRLGLAEALLDEAGQLRDRLRNTIDVGTLDEWLVRNREYDAALRRIYRALQQSGGVATDEVREAVRAEEVARARLPPDTRGLAIIVAEIGRGGANQAVIEIEQARGRLAGALAELQEVSARSP